MIWFKSKTSLCMGMCMFKWKFYIVSLPFELCGIWIDLNWCVIAILWWIILKYCIGLQVLNQIKIWCDILVPCDLACDILALDNNFKLVYYCAYWCTMACTLNTLWVCYAALLVHILLIVVSATCCMEL